MPVKRDSDGNIIDEATRPQFKSDHPGPAGDGRRAVDMGGAGLGAGAVPTTPRGGVQPAGRYGVPTTPVKGRGGDGASDDRRTTIVWNPNQADASDRPTGSQRPDRSDSSSDEGGPADPMVDPPVGWLVIVDGPGKGRVATLGSGTNAIGRDSSQRVSLDYGDETISRVDHGTITYDPRGRKFYVQHGGGTNLTYINDEPVLVPRELEPFTRLQMGNTVLCFVPFCGAAFSWDADSAKE